MEIKLFDNSKLIFEPTKDGGLSVQLWKCGNWRDGHGWLLTSGVMLDSQELAAFLATLQPKGEAQLLLFA